LCQENLLSDWNNGRRLIIGVDLMSYRTILVHLESMETSKSLLDVSTSLAKQHNAHLIALYVTPSTQYYVSSELPTSISLIEQHDAYYRGKCEELKSEFTRATANSNFITEWREIDAVSMSVAHAITEVARTVDLVIMAQACNESQHYSSKDLPEDVILACARPVIVIPTEKSLPQSIDNIFIAWDGREQAVRALFDSLPLLRDADNVRVHSINASGRERYRILTTPGELANTLSRHGVNVTLSQSEAILGEVGDEILQYANDSGADLMVMGAYGHTRIREYVFGGVTRKILYEMTIPVLMSH